MNMRVAVLTLLVLALLGPVLPAQAQDPTGADCDPNEVQIWLTERQAWRNATQDVLDAQGMSVANARAYLHDHLKQIEDLGRPACADATMLWTYYLYSNLQHLLTCGGANNTACVREIQERLTDYRQRDDDAVDALGGSFGFGADAFRDVRPAGWTLGPAAEQPPAQDQPAQPDPPPQVAPPGTDIDPNSPPAPFGQPEPASGPPQPLSFAGAQTKQFGPLYNDEFDETYSVEVTVQSARFVAESDTSSVAAPGYALLIVDLATRNLGPDYIPEMGPDNFQVSDATGNLVDYIYIEEVAACLFDYTDMEAGATASGCLSFEVPLTGALELRYSFDPYGDYVEGQYLTFPLR
jgi:hypothetical protein